MSRGRYRISQKPRTKISKKRKRRASLGIIIISLFILSIIIGTIIVSFSLPF